MKGPPPKNKNKQKRTDTFYLTACVCRGARMYGHTYSQSLDQPGKVANPARGQLNRENEFPCPRSRLRIWSGGTGSAVPSRVSLLISALKSGINEKRLSEGPRLQ